jgi:hypothetical protein
MEMKGSGDARNRVAVSVFVKLSLFGVPWLSLA